MICPRCNSNVNEGSSFCMNCGANLSAAQQVQPTPSISEVPVQPTQPIQQPTYQQQPNTQQVSSKSDNKGLKILAYLGFLVFIPLFSKQKDDPSVKFHIGQGLICFILDIVLILLERFVIYNIFRTEIKVFGYGIGEYGPSGLGILIGEALYVALGIISLIGIINVCKGEDKELPLIGKFAFYK